ncbi:protein of unknown function [Cupriavidus taiwanensis]|uniref:Uncharacterized protein n=1 Tax=Cupriavidus taiwanensis TaxID=164546 RepID=A0A375GZL2_9BURK|nr:hypothetical protein CBM2588_A120120 [Cupriavidus taiwanensis]SOY45658.1 hypothetical protein CBM2592_A160041 [Cupriavidus taiwanensis]SOY81103.1 hypothetical protein CBM2591_A190041 [Cupriavidus taiwanensis]SOZ21946.1 hypothetical protein CBM2608_A160119 [Cupriavidus taiwanensis]SOZ53428.1 hypothetical protein CBM2617_A160119 [Cupriavidus taiwanensis]
MGPAGSGGRATITLSLLGDAPFSLRDGAIFLFPMRPPYTGWMRERVAALHSKVPAALESVHPTPRHRPTHPSAIRATSCQFIVRRPGRRNLNVSRDEGMAVSLEGMGTG